MIPINVSYPGTEYVTEPVPGECTLPARKGEDDPEWEINTIIERTNRATQS